MVEDRVDNLLSKSSVEIKVGEDKIAVSRRKFGR